VGNAGHLPCDLSPPCGGLSAEGVARFLCVPEPHGLTPEAERSGARYAGLSAAGVACPPQAWLTATELC
jgi:hypothetical protein